MTQTISGVVVKRNRVNLSVRLDGRDKPVNLRIDETTSHLQAGDRFTLRADPVYRAGRFQGFEAASKETLAMEDYEACMAMADERDEAVNELARYEAEHGMGRSFANLDDLFDDLHADVDVLPPVHGREDVNSPIRHI